jgi:hypothetical protein
LIDGLLLRSHVFSVSVDAGAFARVRELSFNQILSALPSYPGLVVTSVCLDRVPGCLGHSLQETDQHLPFTVAFDQNGSIEITCFFNISVLLELIAIPSKSKGVALALAGNHWSLPHEVNVCDFSKQPPVNKASHSLACAR